MRTFKTMLIALLITLFVGGCVFLMIEYPVVEPHLYYDYQLPRMSPELPIRPGPIQWASNTYSC